VPYKDRGKQLRYQVEYVARRRLAFVAGKTCACGAPATNVYSPGVSLRNVWQLSAERRAVRLAGAIAACERCLRAWIGSRASHPSRTHGATSCYAKGCRCPTCVESYRAKQRLRVRRPRGRPRKDAPPAIAENLNCCNWCGDLIGASPAQRGRGPSAAEYFHVECHRAVDIFLGWAEPIALLEEIEAHADDHERHGEEALGAAPLFPVVEAVVVTK